MARKDLHSVCPACAHAPVLRPPRFEPVVGWRGWVLIAAVAAAAVAAGLR